jgi:hypothetical protein
MEDVAVTCPLVPGVPHLVSGSCSSPRAVGLGFLQTQPRGDALALFLAFGSAITWREDFHLARSVSCLAHTPRFSGGAQCRPLNRLDAALNMATTCRGMGRLARSRIAIRDRFGVRHTCRIVSLRNSEVRQ